MSVRVYTGLGAFSAASAAAVGEAVVLELERKLARVIDEAVGRQLATENRVKQKVEKVLGGLVDARLKRRFQDEMRTLASAALTPSRREAVRGRARETLGPDAPALRGLEAMLERLEAKRLAPSTVRVMAWYRSRGHASYRQYRAGGSGKDLAQVEQNAIRLRVLAAHGDSLALRRLKEQVAHRLNLANAHRPGFRRLGPEHVKSLNLGPQRDWGYETGKFAQAVARARFDLTRLELLEQLNRYGALGTARAAREQLARATAATLGRYPESQQVRQALRHAVADTAPLGYRVSISWRFDLKGEVERAVQRNFVRAGLYGDRFPATSKELAAVALVRALRRR
jgi:hypothetical protein